MVYSYLRLGDVGYNYYYSTTDVRRIPVRIDENGKHIINYIPFSYREGPVDDRVFQVPSYCDTNCPSSTICGKLR